VVNIKCMLKTAKSDIVDFFKEDIWTVIVTLGVLAWWCCWSLWFSYKKYPLDCFHFIIYMFFMCLPCLLIGLFAWIKDIRKRCN